MDRHGEKRAKRHTLKKGEILRGYQTFQEVLTKGSKRPGRYVTLFYLPASERLVGFIVSRKYKRAVHRNRLKRLMREIYRTNKERFPMGTILIFAKYHQPLPNYWQMTEDMMKLIGRGSFDD